MSGKSSEWFKDWFELRNNLVYKVYSFSFVLTNWKTFYILLFSSNYSGSERIFEAQQEFISRTFFNHYWSDYGLQIIVPALITYLVIKCIPRINEWAYSEYLMSDGINRIAKGKRDFQIEKDLTNLKQDEASILRDRESAQREINELKDIISNLESKYSTSSKDEEKWLEEYSKMDKEFFRGLFQQLTRIIYSNRGYYNSEISAESLALAESLGLIEFNQERRVIMFTKKGLYLNGLS